MSTQIVMDATRLDTVLNSLKTAVASAEAGGDPVVLVCAPAGFGKTTVMARYFDEQKSNGVVTVWILLDDADNDAIYVFATKGGAPSNPDWYYNLTAAGQGTVERGTETYPVTVRELQGDERDRIYDEQARRYPGFADYAKRTAGIRTIPVLELKRSSGHTLGA